MPSRLLKNAPAACCERSEPGPIVRIRAASRVSDVGGLLRRAAHAENGPLEGAPSEERGAGRANEE